MKYSVVICTYNRPELLALCLDQLAPGKQSIDASMYEVIVADDNSNTITKDMVEANYPWAKWVKGPQRGFASNRNTGAGTAVGEWLLLVDDDCLPDTRWIEGYAKGIEAHPEVKAFEGKTIADRGRTRYNEESPINLVGGNFWGCNQSVNRKFYQEIGGVSELYTSYGMEDIDFKIKIQERNEPIVFLERALVVHPWRPMRPVMKNYAVIKNIKIFLQLHPQESKNYRLDVLLKIAISSTLKKFSILKKVGFKGWTFYLGEMIYTFIKAFNIGLYIITKK